MILAWSAPGTARIWRSWTRRHTCTCPIAPESRSPAHSRSVAVMGPDHLGIVRFAELPVIPWRNGGGVTREVVASGGSDPQDFDWRISIADVSQSGPFSAFPGVDRVITLVEGARPVDTTSDPRPARENDGDDRRAHDRLRSSAGLGAVASGGFAKMDDLMAGWS